MKQQTNLLLDGEITKKRLKLNISHTQETVFGDGKKLTLQIIINSNECAIKIQHIWLFVKFQKHTKLSRFSRWCGGDWEFNVQIEFLLGKCLKKIKIILNYRELLCKNSQLKISQKLKKFPVEIFPV